VNEQAALRVRRTNSIPGLINSAQNIGALLGYPLTPFSNDRFGRRATLFMGSVVMLAGTITQTASTSVAMFTGARVLIGFGLAIAISASPLLITELAYPTQVTLLSLRDRRTLIQDYLPTARQTLRWIQFVLVYRQHHL
jgi:MFS family permease